MKKSREKLLIIILHETILISGKQLIIRNKKEQNSVNYQWKKHLCNMSEILIWNIIFNHKVPHISDTNLMFTERCYIIARASPLFIDAWFRLNMKPYHHWEIMKFFAGDASDIQ